MTSIVVYHGRLPGVTVERGELMWGKCERDGKQVLATIVARPSSREAFVKLSTDDFSIAGEAAAVYGGNLVGEGAICQLVNCSIDVSSCFTSVMGLLTEALEARNGGDAFLMGSLEQWSFALSQVLPEVLPWDGSMRISPVVIGVLVKQLDGHLRSAYAKTPGLRPGS